MTYAELGRIANVNWGDTSVTKKSYIDSGYQAFSAAGPDGFLPDYDFEEPGLVLSAIGARCGKCFKATGRWKAIKNTITITASKEQKISIDYLYYIANNEGFWPKRGMAQPFIGLGDARKVQIPLPPLAEQKRIAAILDAADVLRVKRRESLAQLDILLHSTFLKMFGDSDESVSIGEMLANGTLKSHKDGNHGSLYPRAQEFAEHGVPFLSAKSISDDGSLLPSEVQFLKEEKARTLKIGWIEDGDVLLAHNASVGKTFLYRGEYEKALIGTSLTAFRPNLEVLDPAYLLGALRSQGFQQQLFLNMGQTTRNQVPITAQRRLTIPIPPLNLQRRFAAIVKSVEQQKARMRAHLTELDTLFASLQSRAFNGEL